MSDPDLAHRWTGLRQDSGDPFAFGPRVKKMYQALGIPNDSKSLIFSDALTVNKCIDIKKQCDELNFNKGTWTKVTRSPISFYLQSLAVSFGIGTFLTNDFRIASTGEKSKALNIVIKLSSVNDKPCVKLSDDLSKVRETLRCRVMLLIKLFSDHWRQRNN